MCSWCEVFGFVHHSLCALFQLTQLVSSLHGQHVRLGDFRCSGAGVLFQCVQVGRRARDMLGHAPRRSSTRLSDCGVARKRLIKDSWTSCNDNFPIERLGTHKALPYQGISHHHRTSLVGNQVWVAQAYHGAETVRRPSLLGLYWKTKQQQH